MAGETLTNFVGLSYVFARKKRPRFPGLNHVHEDEMLAREKIGVLNKIFGERRVVERGEKDEQCAPAQTQAHEREKILKIGCDDLRLERVERVAAKIVMSFSIFRADEGLHL